MPHSSTSPVGPFRSLLLVAATTLLVTILWLAQAVCIPLALAVMIGFVLSPPVAALERRGIPRVVAVAVVVLATLTLVAGFGYVLARQVSDFATRMPSYSTSIKAKLTALRETQKGAIGKIQDTVEKLSRDLDKQAAQPPGGGTRPAASDEHVQPVVVVPKQLNDVERLRFMLAPVLQPVASAGIVLILVIFALVQREDIRNRFIRLAGRGRLTLTTRTLDEAGQRISRFLVSQFIINIGFGILVTAGLLLIGVPYALLWGVSAAFLRFVPYLGPFLAMLMPAALAFVGSEGWAATEETVVLFLGLGGITSSVIEPVWIGARTGVSSLALLVSAIFWVWLWGPVGLLLSTPLTVCLAVVGRHIPELEFLAILLGDEPPLKEEIVFYQRLLAGDEEEASTIVEQALSHDTHEHVFDGIVVPTVLLAERDRLRREISDAEQQFVVHTILEILRSVSESTDAQAPVSSEMAAVAQHRILGVPARGAADQLALEMLSQLIGKSWTLEQLSTATLASEVLLAIENAAPDVLCIAALPPGGLAHARYLCKRVHTRFPHVPIWVLRTGAQSDPGKAHTLTAFGAQSVATSFTEATTQLAQLILSASQRPSAVDSNTTSSPIELREQPKVEAT